MSKELDRLEHLRLGIQYIDQDKSPAFISQYEEDIDIIERELKRLNYIDENKIYCISENYLQDIKKIKAFKIINEKDVDVHNFKEIIIKQGWTYEQYIDEENDSNTSGHQFAYKLLTEEEFDILKGSLL